MLNWLILISEYALCKFKEKEIILPDRENLSSFKSKLFKLVKNQKFKIYPLSHGEYSCYFSAAKGSLEKCLINDNKLNS